MIEAPALMAFEDDILSRTWTDWLQAHTSFMKPLHRYDGILLLTPYLFEYKGVDTRTNEEFETMLNKFSVTEVFYGFDKIYSIFESRSMGLTWKPLRLKVFAYDKETKIYLIINYHNGVCDNKKWFEILKEWLS